MTEQAYSAAADLSEGSPAGFAARREKLSGVLGWGHYLAFGFVLLLVFVAVFAPWLAPYDPNEQDILSVLEPPSAAHIFGTDDVGRDIFSRILFGARMSLYGACLAGVVALAIGITLGLAAGSLGGVVDAILMRVVDAMLAFPGIILALAVIGILGPGLTNAMFALGIVYSPRLARLLRGQVLLIRQREYVEAAILSGMSMVRVMLVHILPNSLRPIFVQWFLMLSFALLAEAGLSFLGLGVQPPDASWGHMLARGYRTMSHSSWQILFPSLAITLSVLAINQVGDGLSRLLERGS